VELLSRLSSRRLRLLSLLLICGALLGLARVPKPSTAAPDLTSAPRAVPYADVNPLGANFFLDREVEAWKREQTLKLAKEAGIGWIKQLFPWEEIEPQKGYFFDDKYKKSTWQKYDEIVDLAEQYGLRIIARLDRPPAWTRKDNRYATAPPDNLEDYVTYVKTIMARYKGRIQYYQVWNEPNIWPEWGDQSVNPAGYVEMLKRAYTAAKQVDPDVVILSAPLAQTLEETPRNMSELRYLAAMYQAGAKDYFDILAANGYGFEAPPDAPADPKVLNFARLKLLREVMERYGDNHKAVWLNEFGWNASPEGLPRDKLTWERVTEQEQAAYTAQAITLARSWGWIGVLNTWYFRQVGDIPVERSDYFFRVIDVDFTPRNLFYTLKELGQQFHVAPPGLYEETNAAVAPQGAWRGRYMDGASGLRVLQSPEGASKIAFSIKGTELALTVVTGSETNRLQVTVDGRSSGTVELPSSDTPQFAKTTIVSGLSPETHTITLEQLSGPGWAFDTFEAVNNPNTVPFWLLLAGALLGGVGLAVSFIFRWQRQ